MDSSHQSDELRGVGSTEPRSLAEGTASPAPPRGTSVWALLVAAGAGERLGEERPKAFVKLGELPLLAESLRRLDESDWIDAIVLAVPPGWEEPAILLAEELVATKVVAAVAGGSTRAESVRTALAEVPEEAVVALVHDAARPLLSEDVLERVLAPLSEGWDGVVPALDLPDTIKRVDGDRIVETVDRTGLVAVQTPQAFLVPILRRAYEGDLGRATDCASLVEARGGRIKVVPGDPKLHKITTRADLELVASWL